MFSTLKDYRCKDANVLAQTSTSLAVRAAGEEQSMPLPEDLDVPHECEVSPLPVHVVLGSNMPKCIKEKVKTALKDISFCNLVYHLQQYGASEETGNNLYSTSLYQSVMAVVLLPCWNSAVDIVCFKITV